MLSLPARMVDDKGFTLSEILVGLAVAALLLPPLATMLLQSATLPAQYAIQAAVDGDLRHFHEWLAQDLTAGPEGNNSPDANSGSTLWRIDAPPGGPLQSPPQPLVTITRRYWPDTSGQPVAEAITYTVEASTDTSGWQVVRTGPDGTRQVVLRFLPDPRGISIAGDASTPPGAASAGLQVDVTAALPAPGDSLGQAVSAPAVPSSVPASGVVRHQVWSFVPRASQPVPTPETPVVCTWQIPVPAVLPPQSGFYYVVQYAGAAPLAATWEPAATAAAELKIYVGAPFGSDSGVVPVDPASADAPAQSELAGTVTTVSGSEIVVATSDAVPVATYTFYFFNQDSGSALATTAASGRYSSFFRSDGC